MERSILLENARSIEEVVSLINTGTSSTSPIELVAQYVTDAELENRKMNGLSDTDFTEESLSPHFDILIESGAEFDYKAALNLALSL